MRSIPRLELVESRPNPLFTASWHVASVLLLLLASSELWLRRAFWALQRVEMPQFLAIVGAYLAFALFLRLAVARPRGVGIPLALLMGFACFETAALIVMLQTDVTHSRGLLLLGSVLGAVLAFLPFVLGRLRFAVLTALAAGIIGLVVVGTRHERVEQHNYRRIRGSLYMFDVRYFHDLISRPAGVNGGAIAPYGAGYLLVTGQGDFYRLMWNAKGDSLQSQHLKLDVPVERAQSVADHSGPMPVPRLRVTDLIIDSLANPVRVIVGYEHWNHEGKCVTLRVSATDLDAAALSGRSPGKWQTIFESQPCLAVTDHFDDLETGGRLAWAPDRKLFFSIGDFGSDGLEEPGFSQQTNNDYGKVLLLDGKGGREIYSMGHRNPQGLTMSRSGRLWETEHGPQGGDEINLIVKGANYGWPLATYGTQYGLNYWPLAPDAHDHGSFTEPAHVFVPSVGVSNLIELGNRQFPRWDGDLLIASLAGQTLLRARTRGDRVIYVRATQLDRRIRDIAQGSDGRIVLWTDEGDVLVLSSAPWERSGQDVFQTCAHCHEPMAGTTRSIAPSLHGILGRDVASVSGYEYSEGLRAVQGTWSKQRLDAFLGNPALFAPGTRMNSWAVTNPEDRRNLVEYLAGLK